MTQKEILGTSRAVQWLRLCTSNAEGVDSIPHVTKIPYVTQQGPKKFLTKKKRNCKLVKLERNSLPHTIMKLLSLYFSSLPRILIIPFSSSTSVQRAYIGQVL